MNSGQSHDSPGHADSLLQATCHLMREATRRARGHRVEVFVRASRRVRVRCNGTARDIDVREGTEEGIAIRVRAREGSVQGFAAGSPGGATAIASLVEDAIASRVPRSEGAPWSPGAGSLRDAEASVDLPATKDLELWLTRALDFLADRRGVYDKDAPPPRAWVEAGVTMEGLANDEGFEAVRVRRRAWAMATFRGRALPDAPERPRFLTAQDFATLDAGTWAEDFDDTPNVARFASKASDLPLILTPEAAASLVTPLARTLHAAGGPVGMPVGPGWRLADDPGNRSSLVGGTFDDAGLPTREVVLSDGATVRAVLDGPGHYRRGSYRDWPEPSPTLLRLDRNDVGFPERAFFVTAVRVYPLTAGRWVVEIDGAKRGTAEAGEILQGARIVTSPEALARACAGTVGAPRPAAWGVVTPGLVLEGLEVVA